VLWKVDDGICPILVEIYEFNRLLFRDLIGKGPVYNMSLFSIGTFLIDVNLEFVESILFFFITGVISLLMLLLNVVSFKI